MVRRMQLCSRGGEALRAVDRRMSKIWASEKASAARVKEEERKKQKSRLQQLQQLQRLVRPFMAVRSGTNASNW